LGEVSIGNAHHKVGLRILGGGTRKASTVYTNGSGFQITGDLEVDGALFWTYYSGTALKGDILVKNNGRLKLSTSNSVHRSSSITLSSASVELDANFESNVQVIKSLIVEGASNITMANSGFKVTNLYLDDLFIAEGSALVINGIGNMGGHLFVKKNSEHLYDSLSRIRILGGQRTAGLQDYNHDYWEIIGALPEPETYGAILGAVGLGLAVWRKRRRPPHCVSRG